MTYDENEPGKCTQGIAQGRQNEGRVEPEDTLLRKALAPKRQGGALLTSEGDLPKRPLSPEGLREAIRRPEKIKEAGETTTTQQKNDRQGAQTEQETNWQLCRLWTPGAKGKGIKEQQIGCVEGGTGPIEARAKESQQMSPARGEVHNLDNKKKRIIEDTQGKVEKHKHMPSMQTVPPSNSECRHSQRQPNNSTTQPERQRAELKEQREEKRETQSEWGNNNNQYGTSHKNHKHTRHTGG